MLPQGRTERSVSLEEEREAEITWIELGLAVTPILCHHSATWWGEDSKAEPWKRRRSGRGKMCLRSCCFFHWPTLIGLVLGKGFVV